MRWTGGGAAGRVVGPGHGPDRPDTAEDTDVMPQTGTAPFRVSLSYQAPVVWPAAFFPGGVPQARRPVSDHGEAGETTTAPGLTVAHLLPEVRLCPT